MRIGLVAAAILSAGAFAGPALAGASLHDDFTAGRLSAADLGFLELALAVEGDLAGTPDTRWGREDAEALAGWSGRRFGEAPRGLHAALLAAGLASRLENEGWRRLHLPDLGLAVALPAFLVDTGTEEDGGRRFWSGDGAETLLLLRRSEAETRAWHAAAASAHAGPAPATGEAGAAGLVTRGRLEDGRLFVTRSLPAGGEDWITIFGAAEPSRAEVLPLLEAGLSPLGAAEDAAASRGDDPAWAPEPGGALADDIAAAARLSRLVADWPSAAAPAAMRWSDPGASQATGTGFYVGERVLVTADHVIAGCSRVTLADGSRLRLLAADADRDVAAFAAPAARAWFGLGSEAGPRLGERVNAAGFPYYDIIGTALNLTGGNVSALAGVGDDRRFLAFTAPVQPGNSGGPLITDAGEVAGVVVSRLSEDFIIEETGSLPQNMNFALSRVELLSFLEENRVDFRRAGSTPATLEAAVVPLICY